MGRIKKTAGPKREATVSPALSDFVTKATSLPLAKLPAHLRSFPSRWPFPRGDLYHWLPLLDRFDSILESFNQHYGLNTGPQTRPFTTALLQRGIPETDNAATASETTQEEIEFFGFGPEGDRELVETILWFSMLLVENCSNRSLYNSSDRLGDLLNTTSLSLLSKSLRLAVRLAQRYHASRQRSATSSLHLNHALLASHYNIDLEHVQRLADPFVRSVPSSSAPVTTSATKVKEKASLENVGRRKSADPVQASDLYAMARDETSLAKVPMGKGSKLPKDSFIDPQDWGSVSFSYYRAPAASAEEKKDSSMAEDPTTSAPNTPTPIRRTSGLSRPSRLSSSEESSNTTSTATAVKLEEPVPDGGMGILQIPYSTIVSTPLEQILKSVLPDIPKHAHYDLLCRLRVAYALSHSLSTRRQMLAIRILAITNLAYIYPEVTFYQKILQPDADEPRRLQLPYQLVDLIHPPGNDKADIPIELKTIALGALEALAKHKSKAADVSAALSINVNHGVLLYVLRKTAADLAVEDLEGDSMEADEWRDALFSLLEVLQPSGPRTAESLVAAGLLDVLIEILTLRTEKAERNHPKILTFLNTILHSVRDAFQTFANSKGLDAISNLTAWEVSSALERTKAGKGIPEQYRNQIMDYRMPYFQQQTLRMLFKVINHMMSHGNVNFDRLLRNLVDSPQLLNGLLVVISNAPIFGSIVWSGAVNILSSFIHNEPTSYAVIAEAGLSKGFLEAITLHSIDNPNPGAAVVPVGTGDSNVGTTALSNKPALTQQEVLKLESAPKANKRLAEGILPASDAIVPIPHAFGAICLNAAGLDLFLKSGALDSFFEIFESPDHLKTLTADTDLPKMLGSSFDELVRHHPRLRSAVMRAVISMLDRVTHHCRTSSRDTGAKLLAVDTATDISQAPISNRDDGDQSMGDATSMHDGAEHGAVRDGSAEKKIGPSEENTQSSISAQINVATKFLGGFLENPAQCSSFIEGGGVGILLGLATLPNLPYDFNSDIASQEIARVMHMLIEQKPHLVLPSLVKKTQVTLDELMPLIQHDGNSALFSNFVSEGAATGKGKSPNINPLSPDQGTAIVKSLVQVHTLCNILFETFLSSSYHTPTRSNHTPFTQLNLTDLYIPLVESLGRLHRACVWEEILLQKSVSGQLRDSLDPSTSNLTNTEVDEASNSILHSVANGEPVASAVIDTLNSMSSASTLDPSPSGLTSVRRPVKPGAAQDEESAQFKNMQTLRYLLSQLPSSITPFLQGLGKSLVSKRRLEPYPRQSAYAVADVIAEATLEQLRYEAPKAFPSSRDRYAYWIVVLTSISQLMIEAPMEKPHSQCLTLILQAFASKGGLGVVKDILRSFLEEVRVTGKTPEQSMEEAGRLASAYGGIKIILTIFTQITSSRCIVDSTQTQYLIASGDRDREQPYYFLPAQFLVELRMAVLPVVRSMWDSDFVDKASTSILKCLIEILKTILDGEQEQGALKRSDKVPVRSRASFRHLSASPEKENTLKAKGYEQSLAREALYRCFNNREMAEEYCRAHRDHQDLPRIPPPLHDQEKPSSPSPVRTPRRQDSEATIPDTEHASLSEEISQWATAAADSHSGTPYGATPTGDAGREPLAWDEANQEASASDSAPLPPPAPGWPSGADVDDGDDMAMSIDNIRNITNILNHSLSATMTPPNPLTNVATPTVRGTQTEAGSLPGFTTIDDLEDERSAVRRNLIDRALDVLNIHGDITFELADLITVGAAKAPDAATMRKEIGTTLVQSLISFQMDEDFRPSGKKIAAYANLLALVIQEKDFYDATLDELKDNLRSLFGFIKVFQDQTSDEASPWVGQILLIVEKLLAEDAQPQQIKWTPPGTEDAQGDDSIVSMDEPLIPTDEKIELFEAVIEILPRIGKDESLALSVVRVLVILSRNREIATRLGEKKNMHRLFLVVKQLSGTANEKLQSSFMLVLRHIIEDHETMKQIMSSEIAVNFASRATRPTDTTGYVRQMYHLVLRSPDIFVEVTNEKLKLQKFDPNQRPQVLSLKVDPSEASTQQEPNVVVQTINETVGSAEGQSNEVVKSSTEESGVASLENLKSTDAKAPIVEHPDGVIHYLLSQLLSYKDVEDKDQDAASKEAVKESTPTNANDVEMTNGSTPTPSVPVTPSESIRDRKTEKPEFKLEQHPIFVYRCFLLQCLTELLSSYNRTKIEFINYSRKADPKAMTPSKPRSGVLNYLLNAVIPIGTLNHDESVAIRKKSATSQWAISTIVALCSRTGEKGYDKKRDTSEDEPEPELLFVRKFVLEHALKAYKDANASNEPLDIKYSRMLCIADLFNKMLSGRAVQIQLPHTNTTDLVTASQKEIARIMFEKNFISALTSSIADIDLNFPNSKRAIKYILRPLKVLTQTAIVLSETTSISTTPGQTDEDEISTASSISDLDVEREETPDLFRNSTLGMLEPGRDAESSSESSDGDEDMYDDEYDDGMEYEEEIERDGDEIVSDEDEEIEGVGHLEGLPGDVAMDVEVVLDGEDDDQSEDDPDDSEDMDEDGEMEMMDEITGDDELDVVAEGDEDEEEWQDEDDEAEGYGADDGNDNDSSQTRDHDTAVRDLVREMQNVTGTLPRLDGGGLDIDIENEVYMDDVVRDDDDADDDDDEEDMDDEDVVYEPDYQAEDGMTDPPWGWDTEDDGPITLARAHRHHHHHPARIPSPWTIFPPGMDRGMIVPTYRSHRVPGAPRGADDGTNPLLQRNDRPGNPAGLARRDRGGLLDQAVGMSDWVHGMDPGSHRAGPVSYVNNIISAIGQGAPGFGTIGGPHGALHFHIDANGSHVQLPREIQAVLGLRRPPEPVRDSRDDPMRSVSFLPVSTVTRWQEEARLLFGNAYNEKTQRVVNSLLKMLVPPAIEEEKIRKEKEAEALRKAKEERAKVMEEERLAKEKAEKEDQEKKEREAAAVQESAPAVSQEQAQVEEPVAMEGVESTQVDDSPASLPDLVAPEANPTQAGPSEQAERVRATFRGREVDITGLGIDVGFLDALPEELREEVLMQQLAEQRNQAAAAGEEPTDISREFLEALPPEIREELLQQEAQDRRRREREENRRRAVASGGAPAPRAEEMDPASFLASLDPHLRQAVLMEQDEEVLAQLPQAIAAEARALGGDRLMHRWADIPRLNRTRGLIREGRVPEHLIKKPPRRQIVQMLDKAGVATLLRLMFVPQQGSSRQTLNDILHNVSQNRQNRAEVVSLLLSILQDGSTDVGAVERSFQHLSLRAKQQAPQKTPQPIKRTLTDQMVTPTSTEMTPLMVIQQCLNTLVHLTESNPHIPSFFLTEHEPVTGFKSKSSKKGKGKETRASKFALNALLSLLDRELIMESSTCMEQLSALLQSITHPLTMLLRKEKDQSVGKLPNGEASESAVQQTTATEQSGQTSEDIPMAETSISATDVNAEAPSNPTDTGNVPPEQISASGQPASTAVDTPKPENEDKPKKERNLTPPVVPEYNLRLVINILAARECSAKTFRDTLSTINNLSAIPDAKETFGRELIKQAQDLGESILRDLEELVPQIHTAENGTDIQGMALAKFSPSSSDQAKLLRVLTALDYLFDPKRNGGKTKPASDSSSLENDPAAIKDDLLTTLYENSTFGPLWTKLSECLSAIRQRENMLNIATILLPLVEALMVVCKNTTLKETPLNRVIKDFAVASPPPESRMESLFFRFTEDHRKILNDLVRHNPKLMSGTFSLLVKNPKVLEFDNKRNYFTRSLHARGAETRHAQPPLQLSVSRSQVFVDSFRQLFGRSGDEMKYGKLSIRFRGEEGVDAGGVTREWFQVMSRQMFDANYALFVPVASDRTTFHPNKLSHVNEHHLLYFKFIGRVIGKALYEGRALDCHFSRAVYKRMLGKPVSIKDMETLDLDYYKSLLWMLENDITDIITETFSIETDDFGVPQIVDLIENGRNVPVTEENKQEYVQLVVEYRLTGSVKVQLEEFLKGFHDIVPAELISIFDEQELELLISGLPDIDVDDWKNNTEYHNYSASSAQIQWFWRAVRSFDKEERAKLLQFVTGTSKVPLNGFKELEGMNGFSRFNIHRDYGNKDRLPSSHTCFNQLDLPEYDSYEALRQQVYMAMTAGSEYFGFA